MLLYTPYQPYVDTWWQRGLIATGRSGLGENTAKPNACTVIANLALLVHPVTAKMDKNKDKGKENKGNLKDSYMPCVAMALTCK